MHYRYKFEASELKTILRSRDNQTETIFLNTSKKEEEDLFGLEKENSTEKEYECIKNVEFISFEEKPEINFNCQNYLHEKENSQCNAQSINQFRDIVVDSQEKSQDIQAVMVKSERKTKSGIIIKKVILPSRQLKK